MKELIEKLNSKEKDAIFNNSVVSKYINTCRFCGFKISKFHNRYFVAEVPFGLKLSDMEIDLIKKIRNVIEPNMSEKAINIFNQFINKINRYASKNITNLEKNDSTTFIEAFEKAIANKKKVSLIYKSNMNLDGIPLGIVFKGGKTYAEVLNEKQKKRAIELGRLSGIKILNDSYSHFGEEQDIIFVLKNDLAKRYELKDDEELFQKHLDGSISIKNKCKSTATLISRLMRYDNSCEIIGPTSVKNEMIKNINDTLLNYGIK